MASARTERAARRCRCLKQLRSLLPGGVEPKAVHAGAEGVPNFDDATASAGGAQPGRRYGLHPFYVPMGKRQRTPQNEQPFAFGAPTTRANAYRVLRAMQLRKPVLLEGSPGVGKTSLVQALGTACGHRVVRINLSEQTDLMDLLGSDLPVEGAPPGTYAWQDGPFLAALRSGHWVILDARMPGRVRDTSTTRPRRVR